MAGLLMEMPLKRSNIYPIIVLSLMQRSGTNFLAKLLLLHPDVGESPLPENYILHNSDDIIKFINGVKAS